jgi:hypothetical protein
MKDRLSFIAGVCLLAAYVGSFVYFYAGRVPAANLAYFAYLKGGVESDREERFLYFFYYPVYKANRWTGGGQHVFDRTKIVYPKDFNG